MSVLEQKQQIERQINELFRNVMSMSNDAFQAGASVQDLLNMKNRLTEAFENAMQIRIQAKQFNETQTIERNKINIGTNSTLGRSLGTIKLNLSLLRDMFLVQLENRIGTLNQSQMDEIQKFLNSRIVTQIVGDTPHLLHQVGSPVQRARSPNARSPSAAQSPSAHMMRPRTAANAFISPPSARAPQVVSSEHVIVNHHSPNKQPGCFGKMCKSIKSRFSRNSVHPVGGKRKLRRRTRRTRRGRRSRLH